MNYVDHNTDHNTKLRRHVLCASYLFFLCRARSPVHFGKERCIKPLSSHFVFPEHTLSLERTSMHLSLLSADLILLILEVTDPESLLQFCRVSSNVHYRRYGHAHIVRPHDRYTTWLWSPRLFGTKLNSH